MPLRFRRNALHEAAVYMGRRIVVLHDESGLSYDLSLETAKEKRVPVALLGIVAEAAQRKLSRKLLLEIAEKWAKLYPPLPAELRCLEQLRSSGGSS